MQQKLLKILVNLKISTFIPSELPHYKSCGYSSGFHVWLLHLYFCINTGSVYVKNHNPQYSSHGESDLSKRAVPVETNLSVASSAELLCVWILTAEPADPWSWVTTTARAPCIVSDFLTVCTKHPLSWLHKSLFHVIISAHTRAVYIYVLNYLCAVWSVLK